MRILVIGGTQFIGRTTVRQLHDAGHDVAVFHRGQTNRALPTGVQEILGDQAEIADFRAQFQRFAPDVVLNMILYLEPNARLFMQTMQGLTERVVMTSSQDVYRAFGLVLGIEEGAADPIPLNEDAPLRQRLYPYRGKVTDPAAKWRDDYDKIPIERLILGNEHVAGTVLRLPMVYGPDDYQHRTFEYLKRMDDGRPSILISEEFAQWRWTRGYVENVAAAIVLAITNKRAEGRIYNVGEPVTSTMKEWIESIGHTVGWHGKVVTVPEASLPSQLVSGINTIQPLVFDSARIRQELGYCESIEPDEALKRTIAWQRANPPATIDPQQFDYATEDKVLSSLPSA
jgi:nucleoside-diphosphate-sugar epimerase